MNIYLIDVIRGKLSVVYEGHWSKVNLICEVPFKDILITVSESNIKVWDLEKDLCFQNMNEHKSLVVYCKINSENPDTVVTISQNHEYKEWVYSTAEVRKSEILNLPSDSLIVVVCIMDAELAYIALDTHSIVVYHLESKQIVYRF